MSMYSPKTDIKKGQKNSDLKNYPDVQMFCTFLRGCPHINYTAATKVTSPANVTAGVDCTS